MEYSLFIVIDSICASIAHVDKNIMKKKLEETRLFWNEVSSMLIFNMKSHHINFLFPSC